MEIRIWKSKKAAKQEPEGTVFVKLEDDYNGGVELVTVDADGDYVSDGYLLGLRSDGTLLRYSCVNTELGFQLNRNGQIKKAF